MRTSTDTVVRRNEPQTKPTPALPVQAGGARLSRGEQSLFQRHLRVFQLLADR